MSLFSKNFDLRKEIVEKYLDVIDGYSIELKRLAKVKYAATINELLVCSLRDFTLQDWSGNDLIQLARQAVREKEITRKAVIKSRLK